MAKVEAKLTPLQKAWREFASGRPLTNPKTDAIGGFAWALNQRDRATKALKDAKITTAIGYTSPKMPAEKPGATELLIEGREDEALKMLLSCPGASILGLIFKIATDREARTFVLPLDRSERGIEILHWLWERQKSGAARRSTN